MKGIQDVFIDTLRQSCMVNAGRAGRIQEKEVFTYTISYIIVKMSYKIF